MSTFFPPPPPFMGGAQPYTPSKLTPSILYIEVDNPPFTLGGPTNTQQQLSISQPNPWTYTYTGWVQGLQPYGGKQNNPANIGIQINPPPFTRGGPTIVQQEAAGIAQPNPWTYTYTGWVQGLQPYGGAQNNPSNIAVPANPPPFTRGGPNNTQQQLSISQPNPWVYTFEGGWQPFAPARLPNAATAVVINNPPFDQRNKANLTSILSQWKQPDYYDYTKYGAQITVNVAHGYSKGYILY